MLRRLLLLLPISALLALPAAATAPGNRGQRILDFVPHFQVANPTVRCTETDPPGAFTRDVGFDPAVCQPKWVSPPVRALLTFVVQEHGPMVCSNAPAASPVLCREMRPLGAPAGPGYTASECGLGGSCVQGLDTDDPVAHLQGNTVTTLLEFEIKGTRYTIAQTFQNAAGEFWPGDPSSIVPVLIGGWNPNFTDEGPLQSGEYVNMIPVGNQSDLQIRLRQIGITQFAADGIPVITEDVNKAVLADENGDINSGVAKPLATVYQLRLTVRWAQGDTDGDVPED
jgi:hypothetical protein